MLHTLTVGDVMVKNVIAVHADQTVRNAAHVMSVKEIGCLVVLDGKKVVGTPLVQDHKRAYENDEGPNTGGMGSYSIQDHLMPFINKNDVDKALKDMTLVVNAVKKETDVEYKGFLSFSAIS